MEKHTAARVLLGGNANPRTEPGGAGYGGHYRGLVEKAWRTLELGKPLYVVGGFGGAAALAADLKEGKDIPAKLKDSNWTSHPFFEQNAVKLDSHPMREHLGLPRRMEDLAGEIVRYAKPLLSDDRTSIDWNGLSVKENKVLFHTRDPAALAVLICNGLLGATRKQNEGKLQIELVQESLTAADKLDAVAIATLEGVPLGGAGAAIDHLTGGSATQARSRGKNLLSLKDSLIDADWLFLASLGGLGDSTAIMKGSSSLLLTLPIKPSATDSSA